jgi:molybdopterin-guanine dinucleotide biosynthesis adapter protein
MRVIGLAGWSGAGKTTLIVKLIPCLNARGFSVSTLKHAHHSFDVDKPGKDSYEHRAAGASEVLVASANRWALMHELRGAGEPPLAALLARLSPVDFVIVEGFKRDPYVKIEVHRLANAQPLLYPDDPSIKALVSDGDPGASSLPFVHLDDVEDAATLIERFAEPIEETNERLGQMVR